MYTVNTLILRMRHMRGVFVLRGTEMIITKSRANSLLTRVVVSQNRSEMMQKRRLLHEHRRLTHAQMGHAREVTVALYSELKGGNGMW